MWCDHNSTFWVKENRGQHQLLRLHSQPSMVTTGGYSTCRQDATGDTGLDCVSISGEGVR
jgi:hypothetical protein